MCLRARELTGVPVSACVCAKERAQCCHLVARAGTSPCAHADTHKMEKFSAFKGNWKAHGPSRVARTHTSACPVS